MTKQIIFEMIDFTAYDLDEHVNNLMALFGERRFWKMANVPKDAIDAERVRFYFEVGSYRSDEEPEAMVTFRCPISSKDALEAAAMEQGVSVSELLRGFAASKRN